jgi:hypothetical protein
MNKPDTIEGFLASLAPADDDDGFRGEQLELLLRAVRRRNQIGLWRRRVLSGLALVLPWAAVLWYGLGGAGFLAPTSQSLPSSIRVVATAQTLPVGTVRSGAGWVRTITSAQNHGLEIATNPAQPVYREISDDELARLLADYSGAVVRHGPHVAQVIFVGPADSEPN